MLIIANWESDSSAPLQHPRFQGTVSEYLLAFYIFSFIPMFNIESHVLTDEKYTSSPLSTHQAPRNKGKARTQENSANEEPYSNAMDTGVVNSDFNTLIAQGKFEDLRIQVFSQIALTMYYTCKSFFPLLPLPFFLFVQPSSRYVDEHCSKSHGYAAGLAGGGHRGWAMSRAYIPLV